MILLSFLFGKPWRPLPGRTVATHVLGLASVLVCLLGFSASGADEVKKADEAKGAAEAKGAGEVKGTGELKGAAEAKGAENNTQPLNVVADPTQAALDRLRKMTAPAQRTWLQRLEARASRAARLTFDADEAKRQEAKVHAQLHQKIVTWQVLRTLIDEINEREKGIINRLVRQYGNLVFDTFHKQIDVYNQRRQAWLDVFIDWEHAGRSFNQQDRLIDWLEAAIRSATPGTTGPIPERPKFESELPPVQIAPNVPTETAKPPAVPGGSEPPQKAKPESNKPPATSAPKQPAQTAKPQEPPKSPTPEKPKVDGEKPPPKAAAKPAAETAKPPAASVSGKSPQAQPPAKTKPSPDADRELAKRAPRRAAEPPLASPGPAATLPEPNAAAADLRLRRHEVGLAEAGAEQTVDAVVGPPAIVARRAAEPRAIGGASVQLPGRQSSAIAVSLPRVVEPVLQAVAAVKLPGQEPVKSLSFRPAAAETTTIASGESSPGRVEIEQDELAARIRGCNLAFRALEVELEEAGEWTAARLEPLVKRLDILVLRRHDLELFRGVVPPEQRSSMETLASAKGAVSPLAAHIVEARNRASGSGFRGNEAERQRELGRLEELSRRLAALAGK